MSVIIAEINENQGIIVADTMITAEGGNGEIHSQFNERKIFFDHYNRIIYAYAGVVDVAKNIFIDLEGRTKLVVNDIYHTFESAIYDFNRVMGADASETVCFLMYSISEKLKIAYCFSNDKKKIYELKNAKIIISPPDVNSFNHINQLDSTNLFSIENLTKLVENFIAISEQSIYVSDICCIAIMNNFGIYHYYEENMYKMLQNLKNNKMKDKISVLAQSTPYFIDNGFQNPFP